MTKRDLRQEQQVQLWKANNHVGLIRAATGFGKGRVGELAAVDYRSRSTGLIQVVVPTRILVGQWEKQLKSRGLTGCRISVINSVVLSDMDWSCGLLILDEIHRYTAEVFGRVFDAVDYDEILGLTATLTEERKAYTDLYCPVLDTVSMEECLREGWTSPYTIYNVAVPLGEQDQMRYDRITSQFSRAMAVFEFNFDLMKLCMAQTRAGTNARLNLASKLGWSDKDIYIRALNGMAAVRDRKKLLAESASKFEAACRILSLVPDQVLTFSETVDMANAVVERFPGEALAYHSKTKDLPAKMAAFRDGSLRILASGKALDQGVDIPDLSFGLILSGTSSATQGQQRYGRIVRLAAGKTRATVVELYHPGTQDEKWLRSRQTGAPQTQIVWCRSVDEFLGLEGYAEPDPSMLSIV